MKKILQIQQIITIISIIIKRKKLKITHQIFINFITKFVFSVLVTAKIEDKHHLLMFLMKFMVKYPF